MGRVKRGSRGAESRAERVTTANSNGHREAFRAKRVPADWRRCFFSVQDVTNTVRVNFNLAKNWVILSIRRPTWIRKTTMKSTDLLNHHQALSADACVIYSVLFALLFFILFYAFLVLLFDFNIRSPKQFHCNII